MRKALKSRLFIGIAAAVILLIGLIVFLTHRPTNYLYVSVVRGSITQSVALTGNTTPAQSVSLTFGSSGVISRTYSQLGGRVYSGQVLAQLNTSDLQAGLRQAQANLDTQKARLQGLQAGSRPEDIAAAQAALDKAKQDLANMYSGISDTSIDSYAKASDALLTQLDPFFTNGQTSNPKLTYLVADSQTQYDAESKRAADSFMLTAWQAKLGTVGTAPSDLEAFLKSELTYLAGVRDLLNSLTKTLQSAPNLSASTLASYKANISAATSEINTATKNLNSISQNIASQKLTITQLQAALDLRNAGTLPTDISAQEAQVEQAQASVDSAAAKIQNAEIIAPISGVITQFDAKIGQQASPNTPLISIMSSTGYEVDSGVSETDVSKIAIGDKVTMTLDAFPGETFKGSVFYIAPSQTNTQGVITYQTKISFATADPRLKSGFTANIDIETTHKDNVLILPQSGILQNDQGTFVETIENGKTKQTKVTLGIQDQKGNVEILSGVTEGEQVLNIGLKAQ